MNEVYLIRMEWWELALFTMVIAMAGAFFYRVLPPVFEKWVNEFERKDIGGRNKNEAN